MSGKSSGVGEGRAEFNSQLATFAASLYFFASVALARLFSLLFFFFALASYENLVSAHVCSDWHKSRI